MTKLSFGHIDSLMSESLPFKRLEWPLICFLNYACLTILAQLQILVVSLYVGVKGWVGGITKYTNTIPYRGRWVVLDHPYVRKKLS